MYQLGNIGKGIQVEEIKYVVALNSRVGHRIYSINEANIHHLARHRGTIQFVKHRFGKEYFLSKFIFKSGSKLYMFKDSNSLVAWLETIPDGHKRKKALFDGFVQSM